MPHTPIDMSKCWTGSSRRLCQKLVISPFQSEISDVPAGCVWWCPSRSIGNVWTFDALQLTALSALARTHGSHKLIGAGLDMNYTGNLLTGLD